MAETTYSVPDMSCAHCKAAVEGELNKLAGVEQAIADPDNGTVEVAYREEQVTGEQLKGAIEEAGYSVTA